MDSASHLAAFSPSLSPLDVFRSGAECAYYMAFVVMMVVAMSLISSELNKLILLYRDTVNRLGADDPALPPKITAYSGLALFTAGMVLAKPFFVGLGILSIPLIVHNLRLLSRVDIWDQAGRRRDRRPHK